MYSILIIITYIMILFVKISITLKQTAILTPYNTNENGAFISIHKDVTITSTTNQWKISPTDNSDFHMTINLNESWNFNPSKTTNIYIEIDSKYGETNDDLIIVFNDNYNQQYIALFLEMDIGTYLENLIYPNPHTNKMKNGNLSHIISDTMYSDKFFKLSQGNPWSYFQPLTVGYTNNIYPLNFQLNKTPQTDMLNIMYTTPNPIQYASFQYNINNPLQILISADDIGEIVYISSIKITYDDTTSEPSKSPTNIPTKSPSKMPSDIPTISPSKNPSYSPTINPTKIPSFNPTNGPIKYPTWFPSNNPTVLPSMYSITTPTTQSQILKVLLPTTRPTFISTETVTKMETEAEINETLEQNNFIISSWWIILSVVMGIAAIVLYLILRKRSNIKQDKFSIQKCQTESTCTMIGMNGLPLPVVQKRMSVQNVCINDVMNGIEMIKCQQITNGNFDGESGAKCSELQNESISNTPIQTDMGIEYVNSATFDPEVLDDDEVGVTPNGNELYIQ
eukprot:36933_1